MSHLVPVKQYTDAAQLLADRAALHAKFRPAAYGPVVIPTPPVRVFARPLPKPKGEYRKPSSLTQVEKDELFAALATLTRPAAAKRFGISVDAVTKLIYVARQAGKTVPVKGRMPEPVKPRNVNLLAQYAAERDPAHEARFTTRAQIVADVSRIFGVSVEDIMSSDISWNVCQARRCAVWRVARYTTATYGQISSYFRIPHGTAKSTVYKVNKLFGEDAREVKRKPAAGA